MELLKKTVCSKSGGGGGTYCPFRNCCRKMSGVWNYLSGIYKQYRKLKFEG